MSDGTSNVILIDPNTFNINNRIVNSIPQYQNMYIFVELIAKRKGRTVIEINGSSSTTEDLIKINLLGNNQDDNNNLNKLKFTTNYYDGSTGKKTTFDSFGISNINVKINSSYIPQVNIQFVDIRGLSFFNQENSPYRIIFDFPPPTFRLTIKGYYGKPIIYDLHLTKYTSEFQSETGNFVIDASFVAMTFAPLNDILFRYIVNMPLINEVNESNPDASIIPVNTNSLLTKIKNLYSIVNDNIKNTKEYNQLVDVNKELDNINLIIDTINNIKNNISLKTNGDVFLVIKETTTTPLSETYDNSILIRLINGLFEYDDIIKNKTTNENRLSIVYVNKIMYTEENDNKPYNNLNFLDSKENKIIALNKYKKTLISLFPSSNNNDIPNSTTFFGNRCISPIVNIKTEYVELDITDFYKKVVEKRGNHINNKNLLNLNLISSVNQAVKNELGMLPTIYNVFKIILDDVDKFFDKLRDTSIKAENAHRRDSVSLNFDTDYPIYSFPLIIKNNGDREERIAPIELKNNNIEFPELDLVYDFINSFLNQKIINKNTQIKIQKGNNDINLWIPLSPIDSHFNNVENINENPYNPTDSICNDIFKTLLLRFYILSQAILNNDFYGADEKVISVYVDYFSEAEAINISLALNKENIDVLKTNIENIKTYNNFRDKYHDLKFDEKNNIFNFPNNTINKIPITKTYEIPINKNDDSYVGLKIINNPPEITELDLDLIVNKFKKSKLSKRKSILPYFKFTKENLIYFEDKPDNDNETKIVRNICMNTRFLCQFKNTLYINNGEYKNIEIDDLINHGNFKRNNKNIKNYFYNFENIIETLARDLYYNESVIENEFNKYDNDIIISLLILSNFGNTLSPFNGYPNQLNNILFNNVGIIEVPSFVPLYIGLLVKINKEINIKNIVINYLTGNTTIKNFYNKYYYILADLHDIDKYLSEKDKEVFEIEYNDFENFSFNTIKNSYLKIIEKRKEIYNKTDRKHGDVYSYLLNPSFDGKDIVGYDNKGEFFDNIIKILMERKYIVNYYQSTFQPKNSNDFKTYYESLDVINNDNNKKRINNLFFENFFSKLKREIDERKKELEKEEKKYDEIRGDIDIITQTYYSFKNINDKWLSGGNKEQNGYPFNPKGKNLIDSFAFVDRAMNPIGDTIINVEALIDIFDNPDITVFTALSQLLSANGFEFFPLQNFLTFNTEDSWKDCFKMKTGIIPDSPSTHFVCMYIGGSSSYPSINTDFFKTDGIVDLESKDLIDFNRKKNVNDLDDINRNMMDSNKSFPWNQVRAFRVRFGEQNQSMFINMKIDSKEYPETNESIQILSRLVGDDKNSAPVPKGQNLYNLYENRAYGATVTMLGNATIQPTQYFQLENIPLFNGAYVILNVEHKITPNKMITEFSGTKILKYPVPRVMTPLVYADLGLDLTLQSSGEFVKNILIYENNQLKINALYTLKMS